jgi:hypothetical protein
MRKLLNHKALEDTGGKGRTPPVNPQNISNLEGREGILHYRERLHRRTRSED